MKKIMTIAASFLAFGCSGKQIIGSSAPPASQRKVSSPNQNIILQEGVWLRASQLGPDDTVLCGNIGYVQQWGVIDDTAVNVAACSQKYHDKLQNGDKCLARRNVNYCQILTYKDWTGMDQIAVFKRGRFVQEYKAGKFFDDIANEIDLNCQSE